jgi:hypothetical protein
MFTFNRNWGFVVLAVYLIVVGLMLLVPTIGIPPVVPGVLALVSGILILINR